MNPTFCISTSTSAYSLQVDVPLSGLLPVVDENNNQYFATSSCPSYATTTQETIVLPPDFSVTVALGIFVWITVFFGMIFLVRKLTD